MDNAMNTIVERSVQSDADLRGVVELAEVCESADGLDDTISLDELQLQLSHPGIDAAHDLKLWETHDGRLIAFGLIEPTDHTLWFKVHPDDRNSTLEQHILAWGMVRCGLLAQAHNYPPTLGSWADERDVARRALLEQMGFQITRTFRCLTRSLAAPIPLPRVPTGFTIRPVLGAQEAELWVELYNAAFIDHWNYEPWSSATFHHWLTDSHYRSELNLVAVAPDSTLAAFCWCDIEPRGNAHAEQPEGWISLLGTRRGFREKGLGRSILLAGLHQLQAAGVAIVKLNVDAENVSGATRLYESVDFRTDRVWLHYAKDV